MTREEIVAWITENGYKGNNKFTPKTEQRINKNIDIANSLLMLTNYLVPLSENFLCERMLYVINNITEQKICLECKKPIPFHRDKFCSLKCLNESSITKEKRTATNLVRYGTTNPSHSQEVKTKISQSNKNLADAAKIKRKATNTEKYGVEHVLQNPDILEKAKTTTIEKYGVDNIFKHSDFINENVERLKARTITPEQRVEIYKKRYKTEFNNNKYHFNNIPLFTDEDYHLSVPEMKYLCKTCNKEYFRYSINVTRCTHCFPINTNLTEQEIFDFTKTIYDNVIRGDRTIIKPLELDIVIPDKGIAIEYNGLLYHSYGKSKHEHLNNYDREDRHYHSNKTLSAGQQGIQLLHIFENEWQDAVKKEIWKSIISSKLGVNKTIGARQCSISGVFKENVKLFLNNNHLQGYCNSEYELGLFHKDFGIVALLTINKSRYNKNYDWEITRYCNKNGINVVGGFSKLLKAFRERHTGSIITYADKRYSNGNLYKVNGFVEQKDSSANYWYWNFNTRSTGLKLESRMNYQKHKLKDKLNNFDENLTEAENMFNNGYRRIWDCGNKVFVLS